jgi:hypothetical protein
MTEENYGELYSYSISKISSLEGTIYHLMQTITLVNFFMCWIIVLGVLDIGSSIYIFGGLYKASTVYSPLFVWIIVNGCIGLSSSDPDKNRMREIYIVSNFLNICTIIVVSSIEL